MKNAPVHPAALPVLLLTLTLWAACQNSNHLTSSQPASATVPTRIAVPLPPDNGGSIGQMYYQLVSEWSHFDQWLSSRMMQPHRTVFPR